MANPQGQWTELVDGSKQWTYLGEQRITNFDEALAAAQPPDNWILDPEKSEIGFWETSMKIDSIWQDPAAPDKIYKLAKPAQATNYKVILRFQVAPLGPEQTAAKLQKALANIKFDSLASQQAGSKTAVVALADFHVGADIRNLLQGQDFSLDILANRLRQTAELINRQQFAQVHLALLGDYIESFTGLMHIGQWKELSHWGTEALVWAYKLLHDSLLSKIHNLSSIMIVAGNHDRETRDKKLDQGSSAFMLQWLLQQQVGDRAGFTVEYHPVVLAKQIDQINYILSHGDAPMTGKGAIDRMFYTWGEKNTYNILLMGHRHTRAIRKAMATGKHKVWHEELITIDSLNHRAVNVPSLFTGNMFSERLGHSTNPGFMIFYNNGYGKPNTLDFSLA